MPNKNFKVLIGVIILLALSAMYLGSKIGSNSDEEEAVVVEQEVVVVPEETFTVTSKTKVEDVNITTVVDKKTGIEYIISSTNSSYTHQVTTRLGKDGKPYIHKTAEEATKP